MEENLYAVVFTGQGSQRMGMAEDFYNEYPLSKEIFDKASEAINVDLRQICFQEDERLNLTEFTQPAILTAEIAMYEVLIKEFGLRTSCFAGHSLGEYTALVTAGVINFEDAVKIVRERGRLMQAAVPEDVGRMAALIHDDISNTGYAAIVKQSGAEIANLNSRQQVVISGKKENVEQAAEKLKEKYGEMGIVFLNTSAPFHSSLMKTMEREFESFLNNLSKNFDIQNADKVLSNYTGDFHQGNDLIKNLVNQISGPVQWLQDMEKIMASSSQILEVGPSRTLAKFFGTLGIEVKAVVNIRAAKKVFK